MEKTQNSNIFIDKYNDFTTEGYVLINNLIEGSLILVSEDNGEEAVAIYYVDFLRLRQENAKNTISDIYDYLYKKHIDNIPEEFIRGYIRCIQILDPVWFEDKRVELMDAITKNSFILHNNGKGIFNIMQLLTHEEVGDNHEKEKN